ncbi:hypothetical protein HBB16_21350, partial [Pseudonocardia sp. MCCB 268]|nr:hypothetical protein [Pseudonocardia cytotoxica]
KFVQLRIAKVKQTTTNGIDSTLPARPGGPKARRAQPVGAAGTRRSCSRHPQQEPGQRFISRGRRMRADLVRVRNGLVVHAPLVMSEYERTR